MKNEKCFLFALAAIFLATPVFADALDSEMEDVSADAIAVYDTTGTVFQRITDLEQEKVLMQLEKEKAQLDLELDRLAAEKIKLHMEIDTLSGRAEEQQAALDAERAKLEAEMAKLEREKQSMTSSGEKSAPAVAAKVQKEEPVENLIAKKYALVDIIGAGRQLQATVQDTANGQRKKITVGKTIDGYTVKSISLDDGVTFAKDDIIETLNIGKEVK